MKLDHQSCYQALVSHDPRFDGVFFVGVSSTGIYCRSVCPARTPLKENCSFFPSASAAEQAGYRPCMRCRPELAPGNSHIDAPSQLAALAASRIEDGALDNQSLEDLANELHVSPRHLRRVIQTEFGVSPIQLAQTSRLLAAKRLLTDTDLPITQIAFTSGFSSLRRFNAVFNARYHLSPTLLRNHREGSSLPGELKCDLTYLPPFAWKILLDYLGQWSARGVEVVQDESYLRTVQVEKYTGWLRVRQNPNQPTLNVEISSGLAAVFKTIQARIKRLFDLVANPRIISSALGELASGNPGLRIPGSFDGFEIAVHAVLSQQVSVPSARALLARLVEAFGEVIATPHQGLNRIFPSPLSLAQATDNDLIRLGIYRQKARAIRCLSQAVVMGDITLGPGVQMDDEIQKLVSLPGIGQWTAQYIAMRVFSWPDAFPHTDLGLRKSLNVPNSSSVLRLAEAWRPWRAYAAMHLWHRIKKI